MTISIQKISWNRAIFKITYKSDKDDQLYLYRVKEKKFVPFEVVDKQEDSAVAQINITIAGERAPLSAGQWIICAKLDLAPYATSADLLNQKPYLRSRMERDVRRHFPEAKEDDALLESLVQSQGLSFIQENPYDTHCIEFDPSIMEDLDQYSRVFTYAKRTYAYTAELIPKTSAEEKVFLVVEISFFKKNKKPQIRQGSTRYLEKEIFKGIFKVLSKLSKKNGKRILFLKENGDAPTENMAALQQRITERGLDKQFEITCRYRNVFEGKQKFFAWVKDLGLIARSDYIFIDDYTPVFNFIDLDSSTILTQIWHAGVGFKSVGYARFGMAGSPDPYASAHRKYTYALIGNENLRDIYSEVFGIEKEALLATGMPRLDHFLDSDVALQAKNDLHERYPWTQEGRVIVFAPTFRGTGQRGAHYSYEWLDMQRLYDMCLKTNSYFIFEMHHFISKLPEIDERFSDRIFDLSHESLNELFHIADVLVTDYSSCFYDYLLLKKPVVFYVPDKLAYSVIRGVQRSIDEMAPGPVCDTFDEFLDVLENEKYSFESASPMVLDRAIEGGDLASDRAIDTILLHKEVPGVKMQP